jgi:predicted ester cyclase
MPTITETARHFFEACDAGKGWSACSAYCTPNAGFAAQAEPLADLRTLQQYADWMAGLMKIMPNASYALKALATDAERHSVCAYAVFTATHTGAGGPVPPTGKTMHTDYVYVMTFDGDKIAHMTKIWNAGWALRELGWA